MTIYDYDVAVWQLLYQEVTNNAQGIEVNSLEESNVEEEMEEVPVINSEQVN